MRGGYGKTLLATAVCHDKRVIDAFDDGILWVTLSRDATETTILRELTKLYSAVTGEQPLFADASQAAMKLGEKLDHRNCLVVIDDVWKEGHIEAFLRGGKGCARLITTRRFDVARGRRPLKVDEMTADESVQMLVRRLPIRPVELGPFRQLAHRLGEWPLLLKLAAGALRARLDYGDSLEGALSSVNRALDKRSVFAFEQDDLEQRDAAVKNTVELSTGLLRQPDLQSFTQLAIFPEGTEIPLTTLQRLWELDDLDDTVDCAQRLADHSLLDLDLRQATIALHDVMRSYLSKKLSSPAAVHYELVSAWGDLLKLPDTYAWRWVAWHLKQAGCTTQLRQLLFDFDWMQAKLEATDANALIADFDLLSEDADARLVKSAIRLSAHVLARDARQLAGQLSGRLLGNIAPNIQALLKQAAERKAWPWLRPLKSALTPPGGPLIRTLEGHTHGVNAVAVTPDGCRAMSASDDRTLRMWDLESGQTLRTLEGHTGAVSAVVVTPDGWRAVSGSDDRTLRLWDLESGQTLRMFKGHTGGIRAVAVMPDGWRAASGSSDGTLRVWDLESSQTLRTLKGHKDRVSAVAITPDGRSAVSGSRDRTLRVWDLESGQTLRTLEGHTDSVYAVAVTPDGRSAVSGSLDRTLRVWDLESGQTLRTLEGHTDGVRDLGITSDGFRAVSGSDDRTLRVWDLESGQTVRSLKGHSGGVNAVAVTADGRRAVSASAHGPLRVWDLESGQIVCTLEGHTLGVNAVALTPDGCRAVSASDDRTLRMWDLESGQTLRTLEGHEYWINAAAITRDGRRAVSASHDRTLRMWDLETGGEITTFSGDGRMLSCAIAPDGQTLIVGDDLGRVHFLRLVEADKTKPSVGATKIVVLDREELGR